MIKSICGYIERTLGIKLIVVGLLLTIAVLIFWIWLMGRNKEALPTLAGASQTVMATSSEELKSLTTVQLVEGLTRLENSPSVLFNRAQAERLSPIIPLLRQLLTESDTSKDTASYLAPLVRTYIEQTLNKAQVAYLVDIAEQKELTLKPNVVAERLVGLDKSLRQRIGMYDELSNSSSSPVRKSLNYVNINHLLLGILMLERLPDCKITSEQANIIVPLLPVLKKVCMREASSVGSAYEPVVEAQVRSVLTETQKLKVLELVQANVAGKLEVNEESLFKKTEEFMMARAENKDLGSYANFLLAPSDKSREGPSVIAGSSAPDLPVLMRGILFNLENDSKLRLDEEQVDSLELIAPAITQSLNNSIRGVKDFRMLELQGRIASMLRAEQLQYIVDHKLDPMVQLESKYEPGVDPICKEMERFFTCRHLNIAYSPNMRDNDLVAANSKMALINNTELSSANYEIPLDAMVRGVLILLERQPTLALKQEQIGIITRHIKEYKAALNILDQNPNSHAAQVVAQTKEMANILTTAQLRYIMENDGKSRVGLYPAENESVWSRELQRFVEAKSSGKRYEPMLNNV